MTHAELYEIVKDVPKGAWPDGLTYLRDEWWVYGPPSGEYVAPSLAESALVGGMSQWLMNRKASIISAGVGYMLVLWCDEAAKPLSGNTLVEALAAACKKIA